MKLQLRRENHQIYTIKIIPSSLLYIQILWKCSFMLMKILQRHVNFFHLVLYMYIVYINILYIFIDIDECFLGKIN